VKIITYDDARNNPAWDNDNFRTNPKLVDGAAVELNTAAVVHFSRFSALVDAGARGVVIRARTPRVHGPGAYFANVDIAIEGKTGRARVPHNALTIVKGVQS